MTCQTPEDIISDKEAVRVHANANFGTMPARDVLNDGVRKVAKGYHCGFTQTQILIEHELVGVHRNGRKLILTVKGRRYLTAAFSK